MATQINNKALHTYLLRLADSSLTMGQRLAEWCGHGPYLEEDVALTNVSLDLIGHAQIFYQLAVALSDDSQTADDLAFLRDSHEYRNPIITELPKGDFAYTTLKQYFIDVFSVQLYQALSKSSYEPLSLAAQKALMEVKYHLKRSEAWVERLSLSTDEAKVRMQKALNDLWFYTPELFETDAALNELIEQGVIADLLALKTKWNEQVKTLLQRCQLEIPESGWVATGGLAGEHSEHLGYMLAEMQFLQRAYPGCEW
ncbi:1,2-phenylacetyl-CoA epoxidase subunit PaaC [Marinicella litoralis]|uniref:Ring-1,2-phenylacetyl-CoA epoxidase subunit PaaC n=1 Tax=Marinicella litoralis TaxID=644220 RepID=A0A4R6XKJ2_9GAMM|nr:1,2-phenylacetyl-CoA epoxidase subunit PaaC [Marinicella litoralis]TDR18510.1 ring-1,2-phenylacetyl-CoA epoxidase subunit PaaC [Marinicella litoralis]